METFLGLIDTKTIVVYKYLVRLHIAALYYRMIQCTFPQIDESNCVNITFKALFLNF